MVTKKGVKKKKRTTHSKSGMSKHDKEVIEKLTTNFVALQKVMTNVAVKMDDLTENITKLLQIFELSAKNFAEKYSGREAFGDNKEFLEKIDNLLDQNKTIAKGIMLMEEKLRSRGGNPLEQLRERNNASQPPQFNNPNPRPSRRPFPRNEWD